MSTFPHDGDLLPDAVLRAAPGMFVMRRLFRLLIILAQEFYFVARVAALYSLDCNFEAVVIVIFA